MMQLHCFIIIPVLGACVGELIEPIDLRTFHGDKDAGSFEKIIVYNDVIFVGGRNEIYKLDLNLNLLDKWTGNGCITSELDDDTEVNVIKVLLVYGTNRPLLLSCGSACRGMCRVHNMDNLSQFKWVGDPNDKLSYVASKETTVAFFAPGPFNFSNLLYAASTYDNRDITYSPTSVSSKAINITEDQRVSLVYPTVSDSNKSTTSIDFPNWTKTKFIVKYLYGFSYGGYSYFVTTQRVSLNTRRYETRLARICQKDTEFFSYTEVPLKCQRGLDVYNYATTASLGFAGDNLRIRMNMESTERDILLVAFAATITDDEEVIDRTKGSIICSFRMSKVIEYFTNATRDCFNMEPRTRLLEFITGVDQKCIKRSDIKIDDNFCGSAFNHYIEGREAIPGGFRTHVDKQITSVVHALQADDTVALLGTDDGYVIKVILNRHKDQPLFTMFIGDKDQSDNGIRASNSLDSSHTNVYLLTGKKVKKFPIGSCSVYKKCHSCFSIQDPLICKWCGNSCAHINECSTPAYMTDKLCPPIIHKVSPLRGPIQGGTLVTIEGDNFSQSQTDATAETEIQIANIPCKLIVWENTRLQCETGNVTTMREGPVKVAVNDKSWTIGEYDIIGNATSSKSFQYVVPKLYRFTPSFGPNSGGTNVTLEGDLLDIGSSLKVFLAQVTCVIYNVSEKEINCTSSHSLSTQKKPGLAVLVIDNAQIIIKGDEDQSMFHYLEDPVIHNITPHETTISGGTNVTIVGRNLNSIAFPRMVVTAISTINGKQMEYIQDCFSDKIAGRYMICPVPPLEDPLLRSHAASLAPVVTHMAFIMDGVSYLRELPHKDPTLSILRYFPDPSYEEFQEPDRIRKISYGISLLDIKGKDLNLAHGPKDIKVIIHGSSYCNVTRVTVDTLWCILPPIQRGLNDTIVSVEVIAGKHRFHIGYIQFVDSTKEKVNTLVAIIIPVLLVIGIMAVLIAVFIRRKLSRKSFHSDLMVTYTAESSSRESSCHRRQGANDYMDMRGRNNVSTPASPTLPLTYQVDDETVNLLHAENIFFLRDYLTLGKVIGQGHFGRVYKGELQLPGKEEGSSVAVKTLHNSAATGEQDVKAFLQEGLMMKDFHHHNVLTLIGVCFEADGSPMVIIPYMKYGDLLSYIRNENHFPTIKDLLQYGVQIAAGMRYLSDLKFVHRDLAGRNCMLDEDHTVKVADFGLSRDIYERDYYSSDNKKTKLPVKWMAPESLEKGTYNTKTDVWSFGVVLWELMTRGVTPYPDVDNWDVLQYLKKGRRMPQPSYCPDMLYNIMLRCWSEDAKKRPSFTELEEEVQGVITKLEQKSKQRKVGLNVTYVNYPSGATEHRS